MMSDLNFNLGLSSLESECFMDQSKSVAAGASTSPTSPKKQPAPRKSGEPVAAPLLARGNAFLLAMIRELRQFQFPFELWNGKVDGVWVAHIRIKGQMWNEEGGLQPSQKIASSEPPATGKAGANA